VPCYRGADKSIARPGRKQATATKSDVYKPLKKNSESCPSNQVSAAAMTSASDEKWRPFNCFLSRIGLKTYQHPVILTLPVNSQCASRSVAFFCKILGFNVGNIYVVLRYDIISWYKGFEGTYCLHLQGADSFRLWQYISLSARFCGVIKFCSGTFCFHRASWHTSATLTKVFPCFFLNRKVNGRV